MKNVDVMKFRVDGYPVEVISNLDTNMAQIHYDGKLIAEYEFGGAGCMVINEVDPRILINIIAEIAWSGIE